MNQEKISSLRFPVIKSLFSIGFKEILRSRLFFIYVLTFSLLALGFGYAGVNQGLYGYKGFGKLMATLINISIIFVPLFSILPSSLSIAGARENLSLEYVFSFPLSRAEYFISSFLSSFSANIIPPAIVFPLVSFFIRPGAEDFMNFMIILIFILALSFVFVSLGLLISSLTSSKSSAIALAIILWFIFTVGGEIGILGVIQVSTLPNFIFFLCVFLNPTEIFRISTISLFSQSLDILGPFGMYIYSILGKWLIPFSFFSMLFIGFSILSLSFFIFKFKSF